MLVAGCTGLNALNPICQIGSLGGSIAASGFESVLSGISQWVASGAEWLLGQIGDVLVSTTTVDLGATWFRTHYGQMSVLAGVVILPLVLVSTLQAVLRQNPGQLVRTFLVQLPLAMLLGVVAIQIAILSLSATDAMSDAIAGGTGADVTHLLSGVTTGLVAAAADPTIAGFVLLLVALLVAVAAFVLWLELLIRAAAVYVAVLFLPLALATLVWPAVSHWCRRLVETLAALILSKFVIVATLSLAAGAVSSGTAGGGAHGSGFSAVLAGGALLVIATFVPFAILRLIPAVEAGAVGHLEGLRQRGAAAVTRPARAAASFALQEGLGALGDARLMAEATGSAGNGGTRGGMGGIGLGGKGGGTDGAGAPARSGAAAKPISEGAALDDVVGPDGETLRELLDQVTPENGGLVADATGYAIGDPSSQRFFDEAMERRANPKPKGPKPIVLPPYRDRSTRQLPEGWKPAPTGPERPEDTWKWQGVPPGAGLIGKVEPGKMRYYADHDEHGPRIHWLPPVWPDSEAGSKSESSEALHPGPSEALNAGPSE
jgi:hypothetical protein